MANSKYAYVRTYEQPDSLLPNTYMVLRIDGHAFHRFSQEHSFSKPNDPRALRLMDHAAQHVMSQFPDILLGFGQSDEYSFLFRKSCTLYKRRSSKIVSLVTSLFTSAYVMGWPKFFLPTETETQSHSEAVELTYPPSFDGRITIYPTEKEVRDYFSWRQVDAHINNLYNTLFWALVQIGGKTTSEAHEFIKASAPNSSDKNEMLFSTFGINYANIEDRYRKGSILIREKRPTVDPDESVGDGATSTTTHSASRKIFSVSHEDIINNIFWESRRATILPN